MKWRVRLLLAVLAAECVAIVQGHWLMAPGFFAVVLVGHCTGLMPEDGP